jgi:rifampicin phosphotransferase
MKRYMTNSSCFMTLDSCVSAGADVVGGKAYNLALLRRFGVPVPISIVVGADNLKDLRERPEICPLESAVGEIVDAGDPRLTTVCDALVAAIRSAVATEAERAGLRECLDAAGLAGCPLAVRSSAVAEDGTVHSFAGIHDSLLGVVGEDAIWRAIRHCQASFYSDRALGYRMRAAIGGKAEGAVLLCAMVGGPLAPDASGVLFTADPATGDCDLFLVEAVRGLGEALVGGRTTPERGVYDMRAGRWRAGPAMAAVLSEKSAECLVRAALRIRDALADGDDLRQFDIEWAFASGELTILQARPVTVAPDPVPGLSRIWSQANLIEVLPTFLSPMAWSLTRSGIRWTFIRVYERFGGGLPGSFALLKRIAGRPFLELSALQYLALKIYGLAPSELNENLGGHLPEIATEAIPATRHEKAARARNAARYGLGLVTLESSLRPALAQAKALDVALAAEPLPTLPLETLADWWRRIAEFAQEAPLGQAASAPVPWLTAARTCFGRHFDRTKALEVLGGLMAGCGNVVSADHGRALVALGRAHDADTERARLDAFLGEFGHRGFGELDIANPRWREDPDGVQRLARELASDREVADRVEPQRRAAQEALKSLAWPRRVAVRAFAKRAAKAFALREAARGESVRLLGALRRLALEAGRRLHAAQIIDAIDDVFFLTIADLISYLEAEWSGVGAKALIATRRAEQERYRLMPAPPVNTVENASGMVVQAAGPRAAAEKNARLGLGVSPGIVEAVARVLTSPRDGHRFNHGEIIVTATTDPAWTPLFLKAGGLVVEHGGYLSHGAIVAREFAIPAVVDIPDASSWIEDGSRLRIDGGTGRVDIMTQAARGSPAI